MIYYKREGRRDSNFVIYITVWNVYHLNMYHVLDMKYLSFIDNIYSFEISFAFNWYLINFAINMSLLVSYSIYNYH